MFSPEHFRFVIVFHLRVSWGKNINTRTALHWTPEGKRKRGRPKNTWRGTVQGELKTLQHTWGIIQKLAQNRQERRSFVASLHAWLHSWAWVSEWVSDSVSVTRVSIRWKRKSRNCTSPAKTVPPIFNSFWKLYPLSSPVYIINQRRFVCNKNPAVSWNFGNSTCPKERYLTTQFKVLYRAFGYRTCKQDTEERY